MNCTICTPNRMIGSRTIGTLCNNGVGSSTLSDRKSQVAVGMRIWESKGQTCRQVLRTACMVAWLDVSAKKFCVPYASWIIAAIDVIRIILAHISRIGLLLTEAGVADPANVYTYIISTNCERACMHARLFFIRTPVVSDNDEVGQVGQQPRLTWVAQTD